MTHPRDQVSEPREPKRSLCILVADDEPMIRSALTRLFEKRGHTVHAAEDAGQAISLISAHHFDAALIDARMPGDGLTVIAELEHDPEFAGLVMLMTGDLATDPRVDLGPEVQRLQKPFRFPEIVPIVENGAWPSTGEPLSESLRTPPL